MIEILIIIIPLGCAVLLWFMAGKRGQNTLIWAILGAVFGPFAIPFIFLTKEKKEVQPNG